MKFPFAGWPTDLTECLSMSSRIALIHTTSLVLEPVRLELEKLSGDYRFFHMLDEALLRCMMSEGNTPGLTVPWLERLVNRSIRGGADGVIVSCSSLSMSVARVSGLVDVPIESIDTALYKKVLENYKNPVVLMTNPTNREPAEYMQKLMGAPMPVHLCSGAFEALSRGDSAGHDGQVMKEVERLAEKHDAILFSQISMARVRSLLKPELLSFVHSSLDYLELTVQALEEKTGAGL